MITVFRPSPRGRVGVVRDARTHTPTPPPNLQTPQELASAARLGSHLISADYAFRLFKTPPVRERWMGADGSRHGTPAASFDALPLCRPHGTYEY